MPNVPARAPRRSGGAPLRERLPSLAQSKCTVLPADQAGLHCGLDSSGAPAGTALVLPADQAGLHCGHNRHNWYDRGGLCSPPIRRGYIAGLRPGVAASPRRRCSPPIRRGSIAGRCRWTRWGSGSSGCSPPIRRGSIAGPPTPTACGSATRSCSPPIRRGSIAGRERTRPTASGCRVLPADQAGLHCGTESKRSCRSALGSAPRRSGGAPLRVHRPRRPVVRQQGRAPRRSGGAPLRGENEPGPQHRVVGCSPPIRRGSIAGTAPRTAAAPRGRCSPPIRRGSIAGGRTPRNFPEANIVLPADQAGLHCG